MVFKGITIKPEWIYSIIPHKRSIVLKKCPVLKLVEMAERQEGTLILLKLDTDKELQDAEFDHITHIKKSKDPANRVADHEARDENGFLDLSRYERLVEMRKTPDEKAKERAEELEIFYQCKKRGIPYFGPLQGVS